MFCRLVTDSLRYWAQEMRVDGFRFDLATILAREPDGFDEDGRFLDACRQDPVLVAGEADRGAVGLRAGRVSGRTIFARAGRNGTTAFATRCGPSGGASQGSCRSWPRGLTASADLFDSRGRKPWASVNFMTAHDGFTLNDLVSYQRQAQRGEWRETTGTATPTIISGTTAPRDRQTTRRSLQLRLRQMRNMLATLLLSRGTPMLLAGDEFARTQNGNNNAYCQDNEISWIDWEGIATRAHSALARFTQRLIALRRALPMLRRGRFLTGREDEELGVKDVTWLTPAGDEMTRRALEGRKRALHGRALGRARTGDRHPPRRHRCDLLLVLNAHHDVVKFTLPSAPGGREWVCLIDTNQAELNTMPRFSFGHVYEVTGRSLLLFMLRPEVGMRTGGDADRSFDHVVDVLQRVSNVAAAGLRK